MVYTANELLEWKDFPKGLRVLLLDQDKDSASEIKSKLEQMEYIVSTFYSEHEALSAILSKNESFHVAIVEVSVPNSDGRYKFLEAAKDLPTIMTSKEHCLSTMMKCIALGAVEFLIKPLSEEKLRNIWQHVVHKAFNASGTQTSESLKSIEEFVSSVLVTQQLTMVTQNQVSEEQTNDRKMNQNEDQEQLSTVSDKFPAPSTPQLNQGARFMDDIIGDFQDQTKSVDTNKHENSVANVDMDPPRLTAEVAVKEEDECGDHGDMVMDDKEVANKNLNKESDAPPNSCGTKGKRKKLKVDWTPDLHKKFVQAVEKLGVDQAIPSRILELMKVQGLTRHNIASHLQKYRMNRRHILPKEDERNRRWPHTKNYSSMQSCSSNYYSHHRPVMAFPPYHHHHHPNNHTFAPGQVYPMWGQHGGHLPVWGPPPGYHPWQPMETNWHWKPYPPGMQADAWGCPVLPPPPCPPSTFPPVQGPNGFHSPNSYEKSSTDLHPGEEILDKVVKEAMSKPWLPLPIGLKPPSTDSVLAELSRQGFSC